MKFFGPSLERFRKNQGIGLREMARKLNMDSGNYCKIEKGTVLVSTRKLAERILKPLKLTPEAKKDLLQRISDDLLLNYLHRISKEFKP